MLLPIMLYNNLGAYCLNIGIDVLRQLDGGKNIKAIKESVSSRRRFSSFMIALYRVRLSQAHPMKAKAGRFGTQPTGSRYRDVVSVDQFGVFAGTDNVALKGVSSTPIAESPAPRSAFPHGSVKLERFGAGRNREV